MTLDFTIAPLSNGDRGTLSSAVSVFTAPVQFSCIFPSVFPVGVLKLQPAMYEQVLMQNYAISEVLHVAGSHTDGAGARDAVFFSELLREQLQEGDNEPCFVLADITGMPAVLGI